MAREVAAYKRGCVKISCGAAWYECDFSDPDKNSGLCIGKIAKRDEEKWREFSKIWEDRRLGELPESLPSGSLAFSATPWIGQEIGFVHSGEAENVMWGPESSKVQFDSSTISHFRRPTSDGLKSFVSGVLGGRILKAGSPDSGEMGCCSASCPTLSVTNPIRGVAQLSAAFWGIHASLRKGVDAFTSVLFGAWPFELSLRFRFRATKPSCVIWG